MSAILMLAVHNYFARRRTRLASYRRRSFQRTAIFFQLLQNNATRRRRRAQQFMRTVVEIFLRDRQPKRPRYSIRELRRTRTDPRRLTDRQLLDVVRCRRFQFEYLVELLSPLLDELRDARKIDVRRLSNAQMVYMFLARVSQRQTFRKMACEMVCGLTVAYDGLILVGVCIRAVLKQMIVRPQSAANLAETEEMVREEQGVPGVAYFVDGMLGPRFEVAGRNKREYFDRKGGNSMKIQGTVCTNHLFTHLSIGFPGNCHDAFVYNNSVFGLSNELGLLTSSLAVDVGGTQLNPVNVADMGYASTGRTVRSRRGNDIGEEEIYLRTRLARARAPLMEGAFGVTKGRFTWMAERVIDDTPCQVVVSEAVCICNNFLILTADRHSFEAFLRSNYREEGEVDPAPIHQTAQQVHNAFLHQFNG